MNELLVKLVINLPIENYLIYIKIFFIFALIIIIIYSIELIICLYFLFKKEKITRWYAFVPFLNIYHYFKIVKTPFWTIFIPIVNLVVLGVVPYKLAKQYNCPKWMINISIPFSIIVIPYIAFSKLMNKDLINKFNPLKSVLEIDDIDKSNTETEIENLIFDEHYTPADEVYVDYLSTVDTMISNIEENAIKDDYFIDDAISLTEVESTIASTDLQKVNEIDSADLLEITEEDMLEIFDKTPESIGANDIEELEKRMKDPNSVTIIDNAEYKDVEEEVLSNRDIAFGGESQRIQLAASKSDNHICPRCGSSLVGASGSCPGCGAQI